VRGFRRSVALGAFLAMGRTIFACGHDISVRRIHRPSLIQ
jgi:hypothetical protein